MRSQLFAGSGEMARRMRKFDWGRTAIGPVSSWSPTLRMMVPFLLANRFPLLLWWGPEYIQLYNDAYAPILGKKHPERTLAIAMTGFAGRQDREMALRAGFDEHVAKPVDLDLLFERVRVLEASRGIDRMEEESSSG